MIGPLEKAIQKLDIFLVDDQKITNFINKKLVSVTGIGKKVYDFVNPLNALKELEEKKPQLILLDLNMPEIDGWEFLEQMENYNTDAKVIIVTSSTSRLDVQKAKNYKRVIHYLTKPLSTGSIEELIQVYSAK
ncbi:MAG TPA: response regulator [Leeuwenhoekiella sp.]|nr:response regulator [Leeuwenhoekiella sp.]